MRNLQIHIDKEPGLIMEGTVVTEIHNHGKPCFKAVAKIGHIFGSEVEGELVGYGATRELALEALARERKQLYESLWA